MIERLLYTVSDAAELLSISRSVLYELLAAGAIESVSVGRSRRIPAAALRDWVERQRATSTAPSA